MPLMLPLLMCVYSSLLYVCGIRWGDDDDALLLACQQQTVDEQTAAPPPQQRSVADECLRNPEAADVDCVGDGSFRCIAATPEAASFMLMPASSATGQQATTTRTATASNNQHSRRTSRGFSAHTNTRRTTHTLRMGMKWEMLWEIMWDTRTHPRI